MQSSHRLRHLLTASAILLMVASALLTFFLVQENDRHVMVLKSEVGRAEQDIRTLWENASQAERNADAAVIVSLVARDDSPANNELKRYYLGRAAGREGASLTDIVKRAQQERASAVDTINEKFTAEEKLERELMEREVSNRRYGELAFALQLAGLVLVILTREMPG